MSVNELYFTKVTSHCTIWRSVSQYSYYIVRKKRSAYTPPHTHTDMRPDYFGNWDKIYFGRILPVLREMQALFIPL